MAITDEKYVERQLKEGNLSYDRGNYETALTSYENAYSFVDDAKLSISVKCNIFLRLMKATYQLNRLKDARKYFGEAIALAKPPCPESVKPFRPAFYAIKGRIYIKEQRYVDSKNRLSQAIQYSDPSTSNVLMTQIQSDLAQVYIAQNDYDQAKKTLAISLERQLKMVKNSRYLTDDFNLSVLTESQCLEEDKLEELLKNLKSAKSEKSTRTEDIALLCDTVGSIFFLHYCYIQAIDSYKISDFIKKKIFTSCNNFNRLVSAEYLSKAYFAYAELDPKQLKEAIKYYKRRISIMQNTKMDDKILIARINNILGELDFKEKKYRGSYRYYEIAKKFLEKLNVNDILACIEISKNFCGFASLNLLNKRWEKAKNNLQNSLNHIEKKIEEKSEGKLKVKIKLLKADIMDKIAEVYRYRMV